MGYRFNEAEASLPRNLHSLALMPVVLVRRFNEAEASLPRNRPGAVRPATAHITASMRPRQACLGIRPDVDPVGIAGSGFNEAEASLPRNPGLNLIDGRFIVEASMRPRQACLGIYVFHDASFKNLKGLQ